MRSEEELLAGARRLEEESLVEIYSRYSPGLYRYAARLLGDQDLAEDCVAETLSRLIASLKNGGGPRQHLQAYLYRIAHNWITDHFRQQPQQVLEVTSRLGGNGKEPSRALLEKHAFDQLRAALYRLSPEQRQVIVLKYLEEWSNQEIAQAMGKTSAAVRVLHHRGVARLKSLLVETEELP
jgi:RNA polymerase sigma-70 factor (ECF subfamily)